MLKNNFKFKYIDSRIYYAKRDGSDFIVTWDGSHSEGVRYDYISMQRRIANKIWTIVGEGCYEINIPKHYKEVI